MSFFYLYLVKLIITTMILTVITTMVAMVTDRKEQFRISREEYVETAGYGEEKLSTVIVSGSVVCHETCFHDPSQFRTWPIPGATVIFKCNKRSIENSATVVTDENGDFLIDLPSHIHATQDFDKTCSVEVLRVPKDSACRPTFAYPKNGLALSLVQNGIRRYTAGQVKLMHLTSKPCSNRESSD